MNKPTEKFFNTAGPMQLDQHYAISSRVRMDWAELEALIAGRRYFLLHAPRQTGKTSALLELMAALNEAGEYRALYMNVETAQLARNDVARGIATICSVFSHAALDELNDQGVRQWYLDHGEQEPADQRFTALLKHWAQASDKPTVLFIDEVDALVGDTLVSLLRQIRSGYPQRPTAFPQTIVLCGLRDIKDYRIHTGSGDIITGGSAFNIKAESLRLDNFTEAEVRALYGQHTAATGQVFDEAIFAELWQDTWGQPWLVNALAREMTWKDKSARDRSLAITLEHYWQARERLIQSRATHLDQLTDKLQEPRVHNVISALLAGDQEQLNVPSDDQQYVEDLGLIRRRPQLHISNRIYQEIIPRELTSVTQYTLVQESAWYVDSQRRLQMVPLLGAFQQFFRENADSWIERFDYKEAGPQLLLQAFLQRILNGGGRIHREYGLGRKRTDLAIEWPLEEAKGFYGEVQRIVLELKIQRGNLDMLVEQGLPQTLEYADRFKADEAHLIIFNRDPDTAWDDKIWCREEAYQGRAVTVWGM